MFKRLSLPPVALKLWLITFGLGLLLLFPQVGAVPTGYADSDEFLLLSEKPGVAHPPGYGLLTATAGLFNTLLFWNKTAFNGNLLSSLFAAAAVATISVVALLLTNEINGVQKKSVLLLGILITLPLVLLASGVFALYATILEVSSLTALLLALVLASSVYASSKARLSRWHMIATGTLYGLGVSHYQPMILIAPALLLILLATLKHSSPKQALTSLGLMGASFALALGLPYALIFRANLSQPSVTWSFEPSLTGIINLATRKDYSGYFLDDAVERQAYFGANVVDKMVRSQVPYWQMLAEQTSLPFVALGLLGLLALVKKKRQLGLFFGLLWLLTGPLFIGFLGAPVASTQNLSYHMSLGIFQRQLIMNLTVVTILAAVGFGDIIAYARRHQNASRYLSLAGALLLCLVAVHLTKFRHLAHPARKELISQYTDALLSQAQENSVIVCGSDIACFGLFYASEVEGKRPDITILTVNALSRRYFLEQHPEFYPFSYTQNPFFAANLITWNLSHRRVYLTNPTSFYIEYIGMHGDPFYVVPQGLLFEVTTTLPQSLAIPEATFTNRVLTTPISPYDWFIRGYKDYLANVAYFSGVLAAHLDQKQVAQTYFNQALTLKPDYAEVTEWLSKLYSPGLIASYTTATAADRDYLGIYQQLASQGKLDDAYKKLLKASYLEPENQVVRLELAKLYAKGKFTDLALTELEHLELFGPVDASIAAEAHTLKESLQ